jgi:histidinol-phosphate/aromatic aminotransferase/cobyric acid decarboxylase-like protein/molybdopterin-guanine dinucleotide biosynthesis protein A
LAGGAAVKAIVLAAGAGARMRPLSDATHKCLLPVGDSTILGRIVEGLLGIGVSDILVVTGHLGEQVRAFLGERYPDIPFRFLQNSRYRETNNIVSLAMALEQTDFDSDVVLIECDVLFHPAMLARLNSPERGNIALVDRYRPGMDGTVVSVERGVITHVFPPHLQTEDFDYRDKYKTVNIYRFDREFCRKRLQPLLSCYANVIDSGCYYELVLAMLINMQRETVRAEIVGGSEWAEVDDPNDLASARFVFEPDQRREMLDASFGGFWNFDVLDFAFMRNQHFPTDAMVAAMRRALPALARSYGSGQRVLNAKLAYALHCAPDRIQCLSGASQVFPLLPQLFGAQRVVLPRPTFGEYARWLPHHETYGDSPGDFQWDGLTSRIEGSDLVVVVNPNNPTGTTLSTERLHALIAAHPGTMFLVDESFVDFSGEVRLIERLEREPLRNVLVIASLSKSLGVPGLRLGYAYANDRELIDRLGAALPVWNLGSMAEFFLELLLKFQPELARSFEHTAMDRCDFQGELAAVSGVERVFPSGGNFLLVRLAGSAELAGRVSGRLLRDRSMYVKDVSAKFSDGAGYLRLAVRKPAENSRLIAALNDIVSAPV